MKMVIIMSDIELIRKLYLDLYEASVKKDYEKLNDILSDDYVLIHMTGRKQSKEEYIDSVRREDLKYYEFDHESINATINDDKATMTGKTKVLASPLGMAKSWWNLKQELTLEKRNDKWVITHSVASTY